jgi:hypothetical protein
MEELAELMTDEAALHQEEQQVFSPELHQDFWFPSDNAGILDCDQAPSSASYYSLQIPPVHIPEMKRSLVNNQQLLSLPNWAPTPLIDTLDLSVTPEIHVTRQPPKVYRARYEKEASQAPKGLLRNENKEPIDIEFKNMPQGVGDIKVTITVLTSKGLPHPTMHVTCHGRSMPSDWKEDKANRTVTTVVRAEDGYKKSLMFLGVLRTKLENVDLSLHSKQELSQFSIKFEAAILLPEGIVLPIVTTTRNVQVMCPSTHTKHRRLQQQQQISMVDSPPKMSELQIYN